MSNDRLRLDWRGARVPHHLGLVLGLMLALLSGCALPPGYSPEHRQINADLLDRALQPLRSSAAVAADQPLGVYMGIALDGSSPAFDGDIRRARDRLFLQAASGPSLLLSNLQAEPLSDPHADFATMPTAARAVGEWLRSQSAQAQRTPLATVVIASHGAEDMLVVRTGKTQLLALIKGDYISAFLKDLGPVPTIVIISACHSGSLIPSLRAPNRIIITAAAADRVSFGCDANSAATIFMQSLLDKELNRSLSLDELFMQGRNRVIGYEMRTKTAHSLPQMDVGSDMQAFASVPISQWPKALSEWPGAHR